MDKRFYAKGVMTILGKLLSLLKDIFVLYMTSLCFLLVMLECIVLIEFFREREKDDFIRIVKR